MCNPPGGDWSGFSVIEGGYENRWLSLPRVSDVVSGKRPDHIVEIFGSFEKPLLLSIESKEKSADLEGDVGTKLVAYINMYKQNFNQYYDNRDVISLFSGAMGLDIGLNKSGLRVVVGQDFEPACVETMRANGHNVIGGDIREIQPQTLLDQTGLHIGEPFLICGGPPCQPFSTAGKRLGINDPRGSLFMDFIRMIDYIRPRFFVMENVKGIMSAPLKHVPTNERDESDPDQKLGTVLDVILSEFNKLGYKTVYGVLDAVNYGVPQFRERFVLIGSRDHEEIFLPVPTHFQMHQKPEYRWRTVGDVITGLENDIKECATLSEERKRYLRMVPEGGNWRNLPEDLIPLAMGGAYESGGGKVGFFRRLSYSQPSPMQNASEIVDSVLTAFVSSSEETIFGNCFFEPIAVAASGGNKALAEGVDIMVQDRSTNTITAIAVKSGTSVFNADSKKKQEQNFAAAAKLAQQAKARYVAIIGYCYGKKKTSGKGIPKMYQELAGKEFWSELTGDPEFYKKIIQYMGTMPEQYVAAYQESYNRAANRLVREFSISFCKEDGSIDWERLVEFNSGD